MRINKIEIIERDNDIRIQSSIEYAGKKQCLWYAVDKRYGKYITTEKLDGFVVGLLLLAMMRKEDMEIDGAISEKLYYHLTTYYMHILKIIIPSLHTINLLPRNLDEGKSYHCQNAVVTGFSGGIDSFCTVIDHLINNQPANYRITHLLFNNVGSHGEWDAVTSRNLFNQRYDMLKPFSKKVGLEFMKVDSNLSELLHFDFQLSHFLRNLSPVLLFQKLFSKYYYSGAYRYQDCFVGPTYATAYSDPIDIHLLSTETLECILTGSQYSRVQKTIKVSEVESSYKWLNVCVRTDRNWTNCSVCWKCCRTLLTLEIIGKIEKYRGVFDLDKYWKVRNGYIRYVLRHRHNPLHREILEYAKKKGFKFPLAHACIAYVSLIFFPPPLEQRVRKMLSDSFKQRFRSTIEKGGFF